MELADESPVASANIRAILKSADSPSSTVDRFLDTLVKYWGAVMGLVQRQVHEGEKGVPLTESDARRTLFQTMLVMHEIDSSLRETGADS